MEFTASPRVIRNPNSHQIYPHFIQTWLTRWERANNVIQINLNGDAASTKFTIMKFVEEMHQGILRQSQRYLSLHTQSVTAHLMVKEQVEKGIQPIIDRMMKQPQDLFRLCVYLYTMDTFVNLEINKGLRGQCYSYIEGFIPLIFALNCYLNHI